MVEIDPWERLQRAPGHGRLYLRRLQEQTASHEGFILVAEADGRSAGAAFALVRRFPAFERAAERPTRMGYLADLSVLPPWRGRGIGTRLLREVEARFRRAGCDQTSLGVFVPNVGARRLYDRMGYSPRGMFLVKRLGPAPQRWPPVRRRPSRR